MELFVRILSWFLMETIETCIPEKVIILLMHHGHVGGVGSTHLGFGLLSASIRMLNVRSYRHLNLLLQLLLLELLLLIVILNFWCYVLLDKRHGLHFFEAFDCSDSLLLMLLVVYV